MFRVAHKGWLTLDIERNNNVTFVHFTVCVFVIAGCSSRVSTVVTDPDVFICGRETNTGVICMCMSAQARRDCSVLDPVAVIIGIDCRGALVHTRGYVRCTATREKSPMYCVT